VHRNPHIIDHINDVFDLLRINDIIGQVVVNLGVGQETLLFTLDDQIF